MESIFYSPENFTLLLDNIKKILSSKRINLKDDTLSNIIIETMDHVWSNVDKQKIMKLPYERRIYILNKEIIGIILPVFNVNSDNDSANDNANDNDINSRIQNNLQQYDNTSQDNDMNKINNHLFDPTIFKLSNPTNFLDLPEAQNSVKKNIDITKQISELSNERDNIYPKLDTVNLSEKDYNIGFEDVQSIYNVKINERSTLLDSLEPLEDGFNNINTTSDLNNISNLKTTSSEKIIKETNINDLINSKDLINDNDEQMHKIRDLSVIDNNRIDNEILNNRLNEPKDIYKEQFENKNKIIDDRYINNSNPVILPPINKLIEKAYYVTIDSNNRDLEIYPNPAYFQIKFSPASNSITVDSLIDENNNIIYNAKVIHYGYQGATINRTYDNIIDIKCLNLLLPLSPNCLISEHTTSKKKCNKVLCENNILNNPYLLLDISELQGPYEGSNTPSTKSFAKLIPSPVSGLGNLMYNDSLKFINLTTMDYQETYKYDPTSLARLDKMTLSLTNKLGYQYFIGVDKLSVEEITISKGNCIDIAINKKLNPPHPNNYNTILDQNICNFDSGFFDLNCDSTSNEYINPIIKYTGINRGDRLFFYSTIPLISNVIYFEKTVRCYTMRPVHSKPNLLAISAKVEPESDINDQKDYLVNITNDVKIAGGHVINEDKCECNDDGPYTNDCNDDIPFLNFNNIFNVKKMEDYFIYIQFKKNGITTEHMLQVFGIGANENELIIEKYEGYTVYDNIEIKKGKFGFAYRNNKGEQSDDINSLYFKGGVKVLDSNVTGLNITVNVGETAIPNNLKKKILNHKDIFFIQDKLQVSYTFKIVELIKDNQLVESRLT